MMSSTGSSGYALGVDLGTSHTVAVLRRPDGRTRPLLFDGLPLLPSGVFLDQQGGLHVGRDAQRLARGDPARFEPHPKRRVDEPAVLLGDHEIATVDLLAALLSAVARAAVEAVGFLAPAVLTHPAAWGARRRRLLTDAAARAGWPAGTVLVPEPVAAARYFTGVLRRPVPAGASLAVFDFGGGTLDIAVVRNEGAGFAVTGVGGLAELGGLDLDAALVEHLGTVVAPAHPQVWPALAQPAGAAQWRARWQFWDDVRGAKEMLSRATVAPVPVPGVEQAVHLTRDELERVVTPLLRRGVQEAAGVVARCGLQPAQLAGLFLVGGSSRVPLVARLLHAELGIAPTVLEQPELPVAEGALAELPVAGGALAAGMPVAAGPSVPAVAAVGAATPARHAGSVPAASAGAPASPLPPPAAPVPPAAAPVPPPGGRTPAEACGSPWPRWSRWWVSSRRRWCGWAGAGPRTSGSSARSRRYGGSERRSRRRRTPTRSWSATGRTSPTSGPTSAWR
jgi:molecular chaperone DnaK (HSP70)